MFEKIKGKIIKASVIVVFVALVPLMTMGQAGCPQGCNGAGEERAPCEAAYECYNSSCPITRWTVTCSGTCKKDPVTGALSDFVPNNPSCPDCRCGAAKPM